MAAEVKIDSNITGLRYAEEASIKVLPGTPDWIPLEPNSYSDFGGQITTVARNPINPNRQRKKGVITDLDASGGFNMDLTQTNLQDILQGFMFATTRSKGDEVVTAVDVDTSNPDEYEVAATAGFLVGSLIQGRDFAEALNNAVNEVTVVTTDVSVEVADGLLIAEASPPATAAIRVVGHVGAAGDLEIDASLSLPALTSTSLDFTTLGLIPGEWIFIGGDSAGELFPTNAVNNGFKRIRSITATRLEFDKSTATMITETNASDTIYLYFGQVLKNEAQALILRRTYNLERTLGAPDNALPAEIQSEYLEGSLPNEITLNIPTADKITADLTFVSSDSVQRSGATGVKSGNRPALVESDGFNTSSDISRINLSSVVAGDEAPTPLFAFVTDLTITINNNAVPNKAIGTVGSFDITAGTFQVGGSLTAYFADIVAVEAVRNNTDISLDVQIVKDNKGVIVDLPLVTFGDGRPNVEQDLPITLPLTKEAASGVLIHTDLDYTLLWMFFDALPDAADI